MNNVLRRFIDLQLGILSVTRDRVSGIVDELVNAGEISREESGRLADELVAKGEKSRQDLRSQIEKMVSDVLSRMNIASRKEIDELKVQVAQLRRDLDKEILEETFNDRTGV